MSNKYFSWNGLPLAIYFLTSLMSAFVIPAVAQVSFAPPINYNSGGSGPIQTAVGDMNRDGNSDIVTVNYNSNTVSVLFGNGTGTFSSAATYSTGLNTRPFSIALGDVNRDGILDAVTSNETNTTSVLLGTSTGGFTAANQYSTGSNGQVQSTVLGDINKDGSLDIVAVNLGSNNIAVLLNNTQGVFPSTPVFYTTGVGTGPQGIVLGDFNGDTNLDVAVTTMMTSTTNDGVAILFNNGAGVFLSPVIYPVGGQVVDPKYITCGDLNGDGALDIATADITNGSISVLLNTGNGNFAQGVVYNGRVGNGDLINIALGDINGDGKKDIISVNYTRSLFRVLLNNGSGVFSLITSTYTTPTAYQGPYAGVIADLNADNKLDVVTANYDSNNLTVFINASPRVLAVNSAYDTFTFGPYPNPAHGSVTIDLPVVAGLTQGSMKLCDALGRVVLSKTVSIGKSNEINLSGLNSGVYSLSLQLEESVIIRKLIVD